MAIKKIRPLGLLAKVDHHITHPIKIDSRAKHFYPTSGSCVSNKDHKLRGACHRAIAYEYWNTPVTTSHSPETMYTFALGKQIESMFIEWFKEMGIYAGDHIKFYNADFHLSGELDGVLREAPGSETLFGWECKTSYSQSFVVPVITGRPGVPPAPKDEHLIQVSLYLDNFPALKYFVLTYLGRDKFDRTEYLIRLVEIDGDKYPEITRADGSSYVEMNISLSQIYNRYMTLMAYIKAGVLPSRDYRPTMSQDEIDKDFGDGKISKTQMKKFEQGKILTADWQCRYCAFKDLCRSMPAEMVDSFQQRFKDGEFKV